MNNFLMYDKELNDKFIMTGSYALDKILSIVYPDEERKMEVQIEYYEDYV